MLSVSSSEESDPHHYEMYINILSYIYILLLLIAFPLDSSRSNAWVKNLPSEADFLLPRRNRELGILYQGAQERLRVAVDKMIKG